jgi:hypothetical protein
MPRPRGYIENYRPQARTVTLLRDVGSVLNEYRDHWPLTVRQIFYRLVGKYQYPKTENFYKNLGDHLSNARRGRWIPFEAIRDDGVSVVEVTHFADQEAFNRYVRDLGDGYQRDRLAGQQHHIEVWCEAGGMVYQLSDVAEPYSINVYSSGGFDSTTARKILADRICRIGKPAIILHLGDYDPSGEAMFNAFAEDVTAFVEKDRPWGTITVRFERVALTKHQVRLFNLPTAPAKSTDSRSKKWDDETCQLEALAPDQIAGLLRRTIHRFIDPQRYADDLEREQWERQQITHALPRGRPQ